MLTTAHLARVGEDTPVISTRTVYVRGVIISLFIFLVYLSNPNWGYYPSGDPIPLSLTPFSILLHGDVYLGRYFDASTLAHPPYYLVPSNGNFVTNTYYIGPSLTALPIYAIYCLFGGTASFATSAIVGKLSASIICTLSAFLLYVLLHRLSIRPWIATIFTLLYGIGSEMFAMNSQWLWRDGPSALWLTVFLLSAVIILQNPKKTKWVPHVAGLAMGMLFICRPQNMVLVLPFVVLLFKKEYRKQVLWSVPMFVAILVCWELFKISIYHTAPSIATGSGGGGSTVAHVLTTTGAVSRSFVHDVWARTGALGGSFMLGFLGNMVSPSRGLFVFMPWTIFSFLYLRHLKRTSTMKPVYLLMTIGLGLYIVLYSMLSYWDAGTSFGPRYMSDAMPVFTILAAAYFEASLAEGIGKRLTQWTRHGLLALFGAWSIGLQLLGVEVPTGILWNHAAQPIAFTSTMWHVRDGEIPFYIDTLRSMSSPPKIIRNPSVAYLGFTLNGEAMMGLADIPLAANGQYSGTLQVKNTGSEPWSPYTTYDGKGVVHLVCDVQAADGQSPAIGGASDTTPLHTVYPGQTITLYFTLFAPDKPGQYTYVFTLNATGYGDFSQGDKLTNVFTIPVTVK